MYMKSLAVVEECTRFGSREVSAQLGHACRNGQPD